MIDINLLPWRDELREFRRKQFFMFVALTVVVAILVVLTMSWIVGTKITTQERRNQIIKNEIQVLNADNANLSKTTKQREQLIVQLQKLQQLHNSRYQLVSFFNGIVQILPQEIHLSKIERQGDTIIITGLAKNNEQITQLMRNVHVSKWFTEPELNEITDGDMGMKKFRLTVLQQNLVANKDES